MSKRSGAPTPGRLPAKIPGQLGRRAKKVPRSELSRKSGASHRPVDPALAALQSVKESDPTRYPSMAKFVHRDLLAGGVYGSQMKGVSESEAFKATTWDYVRQTLDDMKPKDPIEEMLVMQATWTHARVAKLSVLASQQGNLQALEIANAACDRAANTFRRLALALSEYRHPRSGDQFVAIRQANLADQQLVQNVEARNLPAENVPNEKGYVDGQETTQTAISSQSDRPAIAEGVDSPRDAVAVGHRPPNTPGKGKGKDERAGARRTLSRGRGGPP